MQCGGPNHRRLSGLALVLACTSEQAPAVERGLAPEPAARATVAEQPAAPEIEGPRLRILGIAQDGGLPHVACDCERCDAARADPSRASFVASVAVIGPERGQVWIVDATPDIAAQLDLLADVRSFEAGRVDRHPLAGILLTHAHIGHYLGLAKLGFEAASTTAIPVHASGRMVEFLQTNAPWDQLVRLHDIEPQSHESGQRFELAPGLFAEPLTVPHRGEYTDTFAWYLSGTRKRALYIPDTDPWAKWTVSLDDALADVDLLLLDGTFYSADELPGRDVAEIGHPLMTDSMDRLEPRLADGLEVWFVHLNHSNPALEPGSPERHEIERRGFRVAAAGDEFPL